MKRGLSLAIVLCVSLAWGLGCSGATGSRAGTDMGGTDEGSSAGIANPASTHCLEVGGKLELTDGPLGRSGVCVFADGSRCEEWRLLRGQCRQGECREKSGHCEH
jgi:putative hemolysin